MAYVRSITAPRAARVKSMQQANGTYILQVTKEASMHNKKRYRILKEGCFPLIKSYEQANCLSYLGFRVC